MVFHVIFHNDTGEIHAMLTYRYIDTAPLKAPCPQQDLKSNNKRRNIKGPTEKKADGNSYKNNFEIFSGRNVQKYLY
jgi:hypothetical protein